MLQFSSAAEQFQSWISFYRWSNLELREESPRQPVFLPHTVCWHTEISGESVCLFHLLALSQVHGCHSFFLFTCIVFQHFLFFKKNACWLPFAFSLTPHVLKFKFESHCWSKQLLISQLLRRTLVIDVWWIGWFIHTYETALPLFWGRHFN